MCELSTFNYTSTNSIRYVQLQHLALLLSIFQFKITHRHMAGDPVVSSLPDTTAIEFVHLPLIMLVVYY